MIIRSLAGARQEGLTAVQHDLNRVQAVLRGVFGDTACRL